ncbi:toll/interleukin-1 receptor domain-containing protein [Sorangium sp. So ce1389]|uniref:toll/interleukin-1 receptor domain-containing protein n=1 Tax=Sorangium sp. So ce1389 TaxID=3133336 RepID=UPI003F5ED40B
MFLAPAPIDVFISYAATNERQKDVLRKHLSALKREGKIRTWHTGRVEIGSDRDAEIAARLDAAHLIVLLISVDYLAADAQWREMERALARHNAGRARVIPILLDACDWEGTPFSGLAPLPHNRVPVMSWKRESEAWTSVTLAIRAVIADCAHRTAAPTLMDPIAPTRPAPTARAERTLDTSPAAATLPASGTDSAPLARHPGRSRASTAVRALIALLTLGPLVAIALFIERFAMTGQPTGAAADAGPADAGATARPRIPAPRTVTVGEPEPRPRRRP